MVLPQTQSHFADALVADGPDPEHAEALMLFGRFVGEWDFDWASYDGEGHQVATESGEWIFGWVLAGRAVQDVWIIPSRERCSRLGLPEGEYGTTIRVYDPERDAWSVTWNGPLRGSRRTFVARRSGDSIVQDGQNEDGDSLRWIFSDIADDSFTWWSLCSAGGSKTWQLREEMHVRRRSGGSGET